MEKEIRELAEKIKNNQATPEEKVIFLKQANIAIEGLIDLINQITIMDTRNNVKNVVE